MAIDEGKFQNWVKANKQLAGGISSNRVAVHKSESSYNTDISFQLVFNLPREGFGGVKAKPFKKLAKMLDGGKVESSKGGVKRSNVFVNSTNEEQVDEMLQLFNGLRKRR